MPKYNDLDLNRSCMANCSAGLIPGTGGYWDDALQTFVHGKSATDCTRCDGTGYEKRRDTMEKNSTAAKPAEITDTQRLDWLLERDIEGGKLSDGTYFMEWHEDDELRFAASKTLRGCIDNALKDMYVSGRAA